jgi:hypothetical protein
VKKKNDTAPWWVATLIGAVLIFIPEPTTTAAGTILVAASLGYKVLS